ncbi:hypothetical protein ABZ609_19905, partial [Streptomyces rubiginosohelvolus]|uniref:hypothetical protein n=1 Tax=Streptomyces rubiginosohelvolus TaxID=67362 RepID=UPI0034058640
QAYWSAVEYVPTTACWPGACCTGVTAPWSPRQADRPVPPVLVELPAGQVAALLAGVAALPLVIVATVALRRGDPAVTLRHQGDH